MKPYLIAGAVVIVLIVLYILLYNKLKKLYVKVQEGSAGIDVALEKRYDLLAEEIEAVKKYLAHERETFLEVSKVRSGTEENQRNFDEQKRLSEESMKALDSRLAEQTKNLQAIKNKMERSRSGFTQRGKEEAAARQAKNEEALAQGESQAQLTFNQKIGMLGQIHQDLGGVNSNVNALMEQYPTLYSWISMEHFQQSIFDSEEHLQAARRLYNANVSLYNQAIATFPQLIVAKLHGMKKVDFYEVEEKKRTVQVKFD